MILELDKNSLDELIENSKTDEQKTFVMASDGVFLCIEGLKKQFTNGDREAQKKIFGGDDFYEEFISIKSLKFYRKKVKRCLAIDFTKDIPKMMYA